MQTSDGFNNEGGVCNYKSIPLLIQGKFSKRFETQRNQRVIKMKLYIHLISHDQIESKYSLDQRIKVESEKKTHILNLKFRS